MQKFYDLYNRYFFYCLIFLAIFIPLYPKQPLLNLPKTFVAVRLEDFFLGLFIVIWFIGILPRIKGLWSLLITKSFLLFWFIGGLSVVGAILLHYHVVWHVAILHWLRRIEYMLPFLMAMTTIRSDYQVRILMRTLAIVTILVVFYGFGQIWFRFPVLSTTNSEFSKGIVLHLTDGARVNSTFAGHYDLAVYLSVVIVVFASIFFKIRNIPDRLLFSTAGILAFALLGLTAARVSFVAGIVGLAAVFWFSKQKLLVALLIVAGVVAVGVIPDLRHRLVATITVNILGGGGEKYSPAPNTYTVFTPEQAIPQDKRKEILEQIQKEATSASSSQKKISADTVPGEPVNSTELGVHRSFGIRLDVEWPRAINAFYKNPLIGTGYSSLWTKRDKVGVATDNDYLRSLGETGLMGTASLGLIFLIITKKMRRFLKENAGFKAGVVLGMLIGFIVLSLTAVFIDVLEASKVAILLWLILGVVWAMISNYQIKDETNN